jgi:hypothetical protein
MRNWKHVSLNWKPIIFSEGRTMSTTVLEAEPATVVLSAENLALLKRAGIDLEAERRGKEDERAAAAADERGREVARRIQTELVPPAARQGQEVTAALSPIVPAMLTAFRAIEAGVNAEVKRAQCQTGGLSAEAAKLSLAPGLNVRTLKQNRAGLPEMEGELRQIEASAGLGSDGDSLSMHGLRAEIDRRRKAIADAELPFVPVEAVMPVFVEAKPLGEIIAAAVGKLTPEQRKVMRDLAAAIQAAMEETA